MKAVCATCCVILINVLLVEVSHQKPLPQDDGDEDTGRKLVDQEVGQEMGLADAVFKTVSLPRHFASYDIIDRDGVITLDEFVNVTGVEKNAFSVFHDSDTDDDGVLSPAEFTAGHWFLNSVPDKEEQIELPVVLEEIEEDLTSMDKSKQDIYSIPIKKVVDQYIADEKKEEENVKYEIERRLYHQFSDKAVDLWK